MGQIIFDSALPNLMNFFIVGTFFYGAWDIFWHCLMVKRNRLPTWSHDFETPDPCFALSFEVAGGQNELTIVSMLSWPVTRVHGQ